MDPSLLANVLAEWDTEGDIPNLNKCVTVDAMSLIWESVLAGKGDLILTLIQLLNFVNEANKKDIEAFCRKYSLNELWTIFKHSDQITFQVMIANILAIAIQFKNEALMPICSNNRIDVIYSYIDHFDRDLRQSVLLLLANICDVNEECIMYLIDCGIIEKLQVLETSEFFGLMVYHVSGVEHPQLLECINLVEKCLLDENPVIINDGILAATGLLEQSENLNSQELKSGTNEVVLSSIENISKNISEINYPELFLVFYRCDQLPVEIVNLVFQIFELDHSSNNIIYGCWILIHNKDNWNETIDDQLCFELASYYSEQCYAVQSAIAETIACYYSYSTLNTDILEIFTVFITDEKIGLKMINAVTHLTRSFGDSSFLKSMLPEILEKMNEAIETDNDEVQQAAEEFISEFDL